MKKIYLAGFDVFLPDAVQRGVQMKLFCAEHGFVGLYPFDNEAEGAGEICRGNCDLIDQCDIVIANLNPFRGNEPDSGTCFEVGYAIAKGKLVYGYLTDGRPLREKIGITDRAGAAVENFGLPLNLMLACTTKVIIGDYTDAVRAAKADCT